MSRNFTYLLDPEHLEGMVADDGCGMGRIVKPGLAGLDCPCESDCLANGEAALEDMLSDSPDFFITDQVRAPINGR